MDEWKNLEVDNVPHDILTGGYEWETLREGEWDKPRFTSGKIKVGLMLDNAISKSKYRYRKPEPKQPTHEEILQQVKRELNMSLDTKIADMKKTIIRHMNDLYDSIVPPEETS